MDPLETFKHVIHLVDSVIVKNQSPVDNVTNAGLDIILSTGGIYLDVQVTSAKLDQEGVPHLRRECQRGIFALQQIFTKVSNL